MNAHTPLPFRDPLTLIPVLSPICLSSILMSLNMCDRVTLFRVVYRNMDITSDSANEKALFLLLPPLKLTTTCMSTLREGGSPRSPSSLPDRVSVVPILCMQSQLLRILLRLEIGIPHPPHHPSALTFFLQRSLSLPGGDTNALLGSECSTVINSKYSSQF